MYTGYISSATKEFRYYKSLAEKTIGQLPEAALFQQHNDASNSIATIMKHMYGNMLSRWTDFLTTDGEKEWRRRDMEFQEEIIDKAKLMEAWENGWNCLFNALNQLTESEFEKKVYIRNVPHTVVEAINRQLAHYPYHVGQIVFIGKMICGSDWVSLSIPKNKSEDFNQEMFSKPK